MVLGFAFTEGSANDWIAIAFVDGYGASETIGAVAFGLFVDRHDASARLVGGTALERFGRVPMLRRRPRCWRGRAAARAARRLDPGGAGRGAAVGGRARRSASRSG